MKTVVIPWKDFFKREREPLAYLQIKPDPSLSNTNAENLAKAFTEHYAKPFELLLQKRTPDAFTFEILLSKKEITFYLTCPERLKNTLKNTVESIWEKATFTEATTLPYFLKELTTAAELRFKRHDLFSIEIDHRKNAPMPAIFAVTKDMDDNEQALIQVICDPINQLQWQYDAQQAYAKFQKGKMPKRAWSGISVGQLIGNTFLGFFGILDEILSDFLMSDTDQKALQHKREKEKAWDTDVMLMMRKGLSSESKNKPTTDCLRTWIRILSQSHDSQRRVLHLRRIAGAYRELDDDNHLIRKDVPEKWIGKYVDEMMHRRSPIAKNTANIMSCAEVGKLCQLPTAGLLKEFPQIGAINKPEVSLPTELFMQNVPGIDIGTVIEKGITQTARVPVEAFPGTELKYVLDAYCLPEFIFGEQGAGKSGEAIHRAYSAIKLGQTVFFFDTADGQAVKELHDSLPDDYPDEKLIHIDLTNKAWPIALTWAFNPIFVANDDDDELKAEEAREAAKMFLRQFVGGMATADFTNRMDRYLAAVSRAAGAAPLDIELALTSPSYREELMQRTEIATQPDIIVELEALQNKARRGSDDISVEGILSRLRTLSCDRFRTNLFYQTPKEMLDFRTYADNKVGGYGYCVTIYCDKNSYGPDGQEAIMTYLLAKVLLEGAYSRVDTPQNGRKPFVVIMDEPHRFIRGEMATKLGEDAAVELRKYRCKLVMMNHSREQLGDLWDSFESGGIQVTMYKSKNVKAFKDMAPIIAPLDPEQAWSSLGQHEAIVTRKLPSKREVAFICKMAAPPKAIKDRSARRQQCAQQFGRNWKEVSSEIQARRLEYMRKDTEWLARISLENQMEKEAERARKEAERENERERKREERDRAKERKYK